MSKSLQELKGLPPDQQKALFEKLDGIRNQAKTCNYAALYNVGADTLSESMHVSKEEAQKVLDAYWKRNWAVKKVAKLQKIKIIKDENSRIKGSWLWNPVARTYFRLRNQKDIFSTLNQSTGAYMFDMWLMNIIKKREQITGQFHDSVVLHILKDRRPQATKMLKDAMNDINEKKYISVPLDIDVKFGDNYGF